MNLAGGEIPMLKLLKLMYLVDRTSLIETGFPVTGDTIVAMGNGPVLSKTYDHLKPTGELPFVASEPGNVRLQGSPPADGHLSDYEIKLARRIFEQFGAMSGQQLIDYLHRTVPEWKSPPVGSSALIDPVDILRAAGKSESEIDAIAEQAEYFHVVESRTA
ncbi:MAG TPA: Panacea domain-containing protein [Candidatus Eisenbacteria bacterium]|nr:Panacea domain-containing protein [Candidatus Eisenbacteria bacterium]